MSLQEQLPTKCLGFHFSILLAFAVLCPDYSVRWAYLFFRKRTWTDALRGKSLQRSLLSSMGIVCAWGVTSGVLTVSLARHWRSLEQGCCCCQSLPPLLLRLLWSAPSKAPGQQERGWVGKARSRLWAVSWLMWAGSLLGTFTFCVLPGRMMWKAGQEHAAASAFSSDAHFVSEVSWL